MCWRWCLAVSCNVSDIPCVKPSPIRFCVVHLGPRKLLLWANSPRLFLSPFPVFVMPRHRDSTRRSRTDKHSRWPFTFNVATQQRPSRHTSRRTRMESCQVVESTPDKVSEQSPPVPPRKEPVKRDTVEAQAEKAPTQTGPSAIDPRAQSRITELEQQLQAITQEWRKTARDLNEVQARSEKSNQVNDGTLIDRAQQLRYAIWTFSIQYFEGDTATTRKSTWWKNDAPYFCYLEDTTPSLSALESRLRNPTQRAKVVAAFLWRVLCGRVFDAFDWAGKDISSSIDRLRRFLDASMSDQPKPSSTAEHLR